MWQRKVAVGFFLGALAGVMLVNRDVPSNTAILYTLLFAVFNAIVVNYDEVPVWRRLVLALPMPVTMLAVKKWELHRAGAAECYFSGFKCSEETGVLRVGGFPAITDIDLIVAGVVVAAIALLSSLGTVALDVISRSPEELKDLKWRIGWIGGVIAAAVAIVHSFAALLGESS